MKGRLKFEHRLLSLALLVGLPLVTAAMLLLWTSAAQPGLCWAVSLMLLGIWVAGSWHVRSYVVRPLQTVSNLLAALREGDFSTRASGAQRQDALGEVLMEVNTLSGLLQEQRLGALEATALLRTVMEEIDVAVFTFDQSQKLRLVNRAGQRLLNQPAERLLERSAAELGLQQCLEGEAARVIQGPFPAGIGRWSMRRTVFRQGGTQGQLLVLTDLSRALREEERQAWQRLVRVLGHEINNSLAPITSISSSLQQLVARKPLPEDWQEDVGRGLAVVHSRSESLGRFMASYTQLARLPSPTLRPFDIEPWMRRVVGLERRVPIVVQPGPTITVKADSDQLEQAVINLLRNAAESVMQVGQVPGSSDQPNVVVSWSVTGKCLQITVADSGPGLPASANLFVPFFTTKPGGSGIGLVLSRQIAEAHGGNLSLENRPGGGCQALLSIPL